MSFHPCFSFCYWFLHLENPGGASGVMDNTSDYRSEDSRKAFVPPLPPSLPLERLFISQAQARVQFQK